MTRLACLLIALLLLTPAHAAPSPLAATAAQVGWVTGPNSPNDTAGRDIAGTDLAITCAGGQRVYHFFGDTFADLTSLEGWRPNTVALGDGSGRLIGWPTDGYVAIPRARDENTRIPATCIVIGSRVYVQWFGILSNQGHDWTSNRAGWSYSDTGGRTFIEASRWEGDTRINMMDAARGGDGLITLFAAEAGRTSGAVVAQVEPGMLVWPEAYRYWDGAGWAGDLHRAVEVIPGPVGELDVCYNAALGAWLALYQMPGRGVVVRSAPAVQGPWSEPAVLIPDEGGHYAPQVLPGQCGRTMTFMLSVWDAPYNVALWRATIN